MDNVCVCYYKCVVVKLDPFCESYIVMDKNCALRDLESLMYEINQKYPYKEGYSSIFRRQKLNIG